MPAAWLQVCAASEVVIVIADHHGHLDPRTSDSELVENGSVRGDNVIEFL
jgi:hypothetical protein